MSNAGNSRERMKRYLDAYWEIQRERNAQEQQQESVGERAKKTANSIANALQFAQKVQSASRTLDNAGKIQDAKSKRLTNVLLAGGDQRKAATIAGQEDQTQTLQDAYQQYIRNMMRPGEKRTFRQENQIRWANNQIDKAEKNGEENSEYTDMLKSYVDMSKELSQSLGIEKYGGMTQKGYDTFNDTMWYASQGPEQARNVATAIHLGTGTTAREDDQTFSWDASKGSVIDYEGYIPVLRETGYYDTPDYAGSDLKYLSSTEYLRDYVAQLQNEIAGLKQTNDTEKQNEIDKWGWMNDYELDGSLSYQEKLALTDWIVKGGTIENFSFAEYQRKWETMSDEDMNDEYYRLRDQYEDYSSRKRYNKGYAEEGLYDTIKENEDTIKQKEKTIRSIENEIESREKLTALEDQAMNDPQFAELSEYTDDGNGYHFKNDNIQSYVNNRPNQDFLINAYDSYTAEKKWVENGYSFLTDKEIEIYNYYFNTDRRKAQEYCNGKSN